MFSGVVYPFVGMNSEVRYGAGQLPGNKAILQQKKVIFRYFDLNERGEKVCRRDGHHYVVEPIGLVFYEDNYYLMIYSSRHGNTANYRVDRMDAVEIIDEPVTETALELRDSIGSYTEQAFKMYGGEAVDITLGT